MGLLALGTPLDWPETKPLAEHIRDHGITQFLNTWKRWKDKAGEPLLWGDEIEYLVASVDEGDHAVRLSLRQSEILEKLQKVTGDPKLEAQIPEGCKTMPTFHPEYGRFMIESTPGRPYTGSPKDLVLVERDMLFRRKIIRSHLLPNELPITLTAWPRLGAETQFTDPPTEADPKTSSSRSQYVGQLITNPHARFPTLTANIRQRRGSLVDIRVPLFIDVNTELPEGAKVPLSTGKAGPAKPEPGTPYIHMDAMGFGMGCCCVQITFQAWNVDEARQMYDALVPVAPILLALTAGAPAFRGRLADVDARWNVIAASVDDRTEEERGLKPLKDDKYRLPKSRYDSVSLYIANDPRNKPEYNDISAPINEKVRQRLLTEGGLDDKLASHIGHLFVRDPLVQFSETIDQDDEQSMDHFENIQSTNWQTVRFKPPPVNSDIGWRVEFRPMEVQMTDFENAAFSIFIVLLSRAILSFNLNFYMPISQVDENMQKAQQRNGARDNTFFFRRHVFPQDLSTYDLDSRPVTPPLSASTGELHPGATEAAHRLTNGLSKKHLDRLNGANGHANGSNGSNHHNTAPAHSRDPHANGGRAGHLPSASSFSSCTSLMEEDELNGPEVVAMTMDEVINGRQDGTFPGLLGVVNAYLNSINVDVATKSEIRKYLDLIKLRARGDLVTPATWIRHFITSHPEYKGDSLVNDAVQADLIKAVDEIERGVRPAPELLGEHYVGSGASGCL